MAWTPGRHCALGESAPMGSMINEAGEDCKSQILKGLKCVTNAGLILEVIAAINFYFSKLRFSGLLTA